MEDQKQATRELAKLYLDRGEPDGWFEEFYARAQGDITKIYWADLKANPWLVDWASKHPGNNEKKAMIVGCGLGDDAEALAASGYQVIAFDISESAIAMCRKRYRGSRVDYRVADLFSLPADWSQNFDLVYECNTIQILTDDNRLRAIRTISTLVAPGGHLLVSCRSGETETRENQFPVPLDRKELDAFIRTGLHEEYFEAYEDDQDPPVPHFWAVYTRPKGLKPT